MRIIAGALKGRILKTVSGPGYRPATSRVREAVFSMLEARGVVWSGTRGLDLFAGSGSLGFEALSRGAEEICFVEKSVAAVECLHRNVEVLGLTTEQCHVVSSDVVSFLRSRPYIGYHIIFIDPPYGENKLAPALRAVQRGEWLVPGGFILAEVEASLRSAEFMPDAEAFLSLEVDRTYGQTRILLWQALQNA